MKNEMLEYWKFEKIQTERLIIMANTGITMLVQHIEFQRKISSPEIKAMLGDVKKTKVYLEDQRQLLDEHKAKLKSIIAIIDSYKTSLAINHKASKN